jgi:hypothetical protein
MFEFQLQRVLLDCEQLGSSSLAVKYRFLADQSLLGAA